MLTLPIAELDQWWSTLLWSMLRVGGFFMVVPVIGSQLVPPRLRIALTLATALAIAPLVKGAPSLQTLSLATMLDAGGEILIGVALGFATVVFFQLFVVAGQFIAMQMGLGFAAMIDPANGVSVTVLSQFFLMMVSLTFIAMNGHLVLLEVLIHGFERLPIGIDGGLTELAKSLVDLGAWMFAGGVLIALPAVTALLVVNLSFGVMSRVAPQLNVFSLGFPFSLLFGLAILWVSLYGFGPQFQVLSERFFEWSARFG